MKGAIAATLLLCLPGSIAMAQQSADTASVSFSFSNPALQPPQYSFVVHTDGTGRYHEGPPGNIDAAAAVPGNSDTTDQDVVIDAKLTALLFMLAHKHHLFAEHCELNQKNVAFTGTKVLGFAGPEGSGSCSFNYAKDAQLQAVATSLIAVAYTVAQGRVLQSLLLHDKLGLEAATAVLAQQQANGQALDIENIAPVLRAIAADPNVLNRTRTRAAAMLTMTTTLRER
ncbi:hypothetical protein [Acidipila sp. EB88]|uniref:hypothetical protein n=1 Tax=Acidipila sp. EB88 TaxID=2305226 RepID=UPI000F5F2F06|nr:hypothetical protein [Acidipila sp. EB88]RRA49708.1 hypothetical protein D1Y84_16970 [Acidipila sp. EB88]